MRLPVVLFPLRGPVWLPGCLALLLFTAGILPGSDDVVFKSDVALSREDVQVVDRDGRAVTGLTVRDFVLRVDGNSTPIKNFDSESMPIDILLLLDVSGSMGPHVERIANAAREALGVLAEHDRIAIMVFDTRARERLPFTSDHDQVSRELSRLVRSESFNGGTRITGAMIEAASYLQRRARPDARRAIVILTDDETQDSEDEPRVERALLQANAVLSFLQAPYEVPTQGSYPPRRRRGGGIGFPGGGGGWPGGGGGGGGWPGGGGIPGVPGSSPADPSHTAGTETIAQDSGGDTFSINNASALEETLERLRQRYALHFYLADGSQVQTHHNVRVDLSQEARIRFGGAEVRSRQVFMSGGTGQTGGPTVVTRQSAPAEPAPRDNSAEPTTHGRRAAVNEDSSGPAVTTITDPPANDKSSESAPQN